MPKPQGFWNSFPTRKGIRRRARGCCRTLGPFEDDGRKTVRPTAGDVKAMPTHRGTSEETGRCRQPVQVRQGHPGFKTRES